MNTLSLRLRILLTLMLAFGIGAMAQHPALGGGISGTMYFAYLMPDIYHADDKQALRDFLIQENNYTKVGLTATDIATWEDDETWVENLIGVTWNEETPKRVIKIDWNNKGFEGSLNMSGCAVLDNLNCNYNQLTELNVSNNTALTSLSCANNQLSTLNISNNTVLKYLYCYNNHLTAIDVSNNTALEEFYCNYNELTTLNVSSNTALQLLNCNNNHLTAINLTGLNSLIVFNGINQTISLTLTKNTISGYYELAIPLYNPFLGASSAITYDNENGILQSSNSSETYTNFSVSTGQSGSYLSGIMYLTYLNVPDIYHADDKQALRNFLIQNDNYTKVGLGLTATDIATWEDDEAWVPKIKCITWNEETPKRVIAINWNNEDIVGELNLSGCVALKLLYCNYNQLSALDVSKNTALLFLECIKNQLTVLDVSNNTALKELFCTYNKLTELNLSNNTALEILSCGNNQLTVLDVSNNMLLKSLNCSSNQLTVLDVSNNTALQFLGCVNNQLTVLDVNNNMLLKNLGCNHNQLTTLNVSNSKTLVTLYCYNNHLTALDLSGLNVLEYFSGDTQTVSLTLSQNGDNYQTTLPLNAPVFGEAAITYTEGLLQSNSNSVMSTFFAVETGHATFILSGTMSFTYSGDVGIAEVHSSSMVLYPNPTKDVLIIKNEELRIENYNIFNVSGQVLIQGALSGETTVIDVKALPSGMYFIKIGNTTGKFIKE